MRSYGPNSYSDNLAQKKRRRFFIRLYITLSVFIFLSGLAVYSMFYSGWMDITSISITGFKTADENRLSQIIHSAIDDKVLPILHIKYGKNTYFFDPDQVKENILAQFTVIKDVKIEKKYPHNINVEISERTPVGTWCYGDNGSPTLTTGCTYFDESGILWGKAIKSSGSLLLTVEDNRTTSEPHDKIEENLLKSIQSSLIGLENLNIKVTGILIPANSINDFYIYTVPGYYLMLNEDISIDKQVGVLKVFLNEKGPDFKTEYIDLRIEGRVYYK